MDGTLIQATGLVKTFHNRRTGSVIAVHGVDLQVRRL